MGRVVAAVHARGSTPTPAIHSAAGAPRAPGWTLGLIGVAWVLVVAAQLSGQAGLLHHHELIEGGAPLWLAALLFVPAWQVMVVAMMLPASLPAVRAVADAPALAPRSGGRSGGARTASFLAVYAVGWALFGLVAFVGDVVVHRTVDATPWLATHAWLIELGVLVTAGTWQLAPMKRRGLAACRHPIDIVARRSTPRAGLRHLRDCLASSWALMLLMFAAGFANLAWMAVLAALMAYEATGRHGVRVATIAGVALLGLAGIVAWSGLNGSAVLGPLV